MKNKRIGLCITGSFCTHQSVLDVTKELSKHNTITPIISYSVRDFDTRFFKRQDFLQKLKEASNSNTVIDSIVEAEPIGPNKPFDIVVVAPCTGNTLAKLANGITDTPVLMAVKAHLRNGLPAVLSVATNDALSNNAANIGRLLNTRNIYFVPMLQDDSLKKPRSVVADLTLLEKTCQLALKNIQIQPINI